MGETQYKLPFPADRIAELLNIINELGAWAKASEKPTYTAEEVGARPSTWTPSASEVGAEPSGTAAASVSSHNTAEDAHADIRLLIAGLTSRLNALADSDDETLDQVSELVAYIKANRSLIEQITTGKVSVSDIVDNLTTNVSNKPLSAAQGVVLKGLIDALQTAVNSAAANLSSHTGNDTVHITSAERTKWNQAVTDVGNLSEEIANYLPKSQGASNVGKILVVGTDGNLTLTDMPEGGASGDVIGTLDEANNILLSGNLADGTYTLKYENEDGTYTEVGTLKVGAIPEPEPEPTNLFVVGGDGYILNGRCSSAGADRTDSPGYIVASYIEIKNGDTVYIKNAAVATSTYSGMKLADGGTIGLNIGNSEYITNFSESGGITQFTVNKSDAAFIRICLAVASTATTDEYVASMGIIITVNEPLS